MFVRLVYESFRRQKRRKLSGEPRITSGVSCGDGDDCGGDRHRRQNQSRTAQPSAPICVVTPQEDSLDVEIGGVNLKPPSDGAFLSEAEPAQRSSGTFWHNNITGFSPMLPVKVPSLSDGKKDVTRARHLLCKASFDSARDDFRLVCASRIRGGR